MNIVFFTRHFYPHIGGVEKHLLQVASLLSKKHKIIVISEQHDPELPETEIYNGITIQRIPIKTNEKQKKFEIWKYLFSHKDILKSADIVHIHDVFFWYLPFRLIFPSKKVYMTFHGYEGDSLPTRRAILSHKIAEVLSWGNICVGDYLQKWYGTKPTIVTYGAIRPQKSAPVSFKSSKKIKALYIGRLEKEAGIIEYLKLVKRLVETGHKISVTVLGNGSQYTQAYSYVKRYNLPVVFKGFVESVETYLPRFDMVFTSRYLGTLESMYYKKPVLCVYNNAIKRDCFVLSPFSDWIYLASNTKELYDQYREIMTNQKERVGNCSKAHAWVRRETWQKMAKHYEQLWSK